MEETVKHRLLLFIKEKGLSQKRFEEAAHISNGYVNNLKASPSSKVLQKIFGAYPELSQSWLLTGEGPMLTSSSDMSIVNGDHSSQAVGDGATATNSEGVKECLEIIKQQQEMMKSQAETIKNQSDAITRLIERLSN